MFQATRHQVVFAPYVQGVNDISAVLYLSVSLPNEVAIAYTALNYTALESPAVGHRWSPQALIGTSNFGLLFSFVSAPRISSLKKLHCYHRCYLITTCNFIYIVLFWGLTF